jgi:hypothetical protein
MASNKKWSIDTRYGYARKLENDLVAMFNKQKPCMEDACP